MANNYLQFCEVLKLNNEKETAWWEANPDEEDWPEGVDISTFDNGEGVCVRFMAEESGDVDALGKLIYRFMVETDSQGTFSLTWSETCSKMRVGEFGGGYMVVSNKGCAIQRAHELAQQEILALGKGDQK